MTHLAGVKSNRVRLDDVEAGASYHALEDAPQPSCTTLARPQCQRPVDDSLPPPTLSPHSIQEAVELSVQCFDILRNTSSKAANPPKSHVKLPRSNAICTSHYTWWSFVPVFLYRTFRKPANFYFLTIGFLQMIPPISPTNGVPLQFLPLSIVVLIDGIFAAIEDYHRHRADNDMNGTRCLRYNVTSGAFETAAWKDIVVGDLLQLQDNDVVPADLVVVATDGQVAAGCYIETKSLDGETNLKLREPLLQAQFDNVAEPDIAAILNGLEFAHDQPPTPNIHVHRGAVHCRMPNTLSVDAEDNVVTLPISVQHTAWRGCKIRNTQRIWGVVAYVGVDTKLMQGLKIQAMKQSTIDSVTDAQVILLVAMLVVLCVVGASLHTTWSTPALPSYLGRSAPDSPFIASFFYFLITMASILPITLNVSITAVKNLQGYFMTRDKDMFDSDRNMPMQARNKALNEQLGHITHIFSDKTGTITCNKMDFRKCTIRGVSYGNGTTAIGRAAARAQCTPNNSTDATDEGSHESLDTPVIPNVHFQDQRLYADLDGASGPEQAKAIRWFFTHLALSHSVLLDARREFAASSPDELALVSAAKYFGFAFVERHPGSIIIQLAQDGSSETYYLLAVFEFTSARKRMSVVVQSCNDSQDVVVLSKGADSVLWPRLRSDAWVEATKSHLHGFATEGLRTLVIASKTIALVEWERFYAEYQLAQVHSADRVEQLQDDMEDNLTLLGVTGIEDRLQDRVPETLELLSKAGNRRECWLRLFPTHHNDMDRYIVNAHTCPTRISLLHHLDELYNRLVGSASSFTSHQAAIVIDGTSLSLLLHGIKTSYNSKSTCTDPDNTSSSTDALHFLRVALLCRVVIACRCSPSQKARLVELVQVHCADARTLAIGDGANDVPMISTAHVGVGIAGEEGRQAVNSSDFAVGQFHFLARLVLVHGRWNYTRVAHLIGFTYYKNIVYCMSMFWFMLTYSAYSGSLIYAVFIQQGYNLFFTALPIIAYAVLDQDVPANIAMALPQLYHVTGRRLFDRHQFWTWICLGVVDSVLLLYLVTLSGVLVDPFSATTSLVTLGDLGWTALCLFMNIRIMLVVSTWNSFLLASIGISLGFVYGLQIAIDVLWLQVPTWEAPYWWLLHYPMTWVVQLLVLVGIVFKDVWYAAYQRRFHPTRATTGRPSLESLQSIEFPPVKWILPHLHSLHDNMEPDTSVPTERMRQEGSHHGFAFGQPANILRWLLRKSKPLYATALPQPRRWDTTFLQFVLASASDVFENERYQPFLGFGHTYPGHLLPSDRGHWSNATGSVSTNQDISTALLTLDENPNGDDHGWEYAWDFSQFPQRTCHRKLGLVRRRRWVVRDVAAAPASTAV
ncbi:hypothetical protein AaE_013656 [Aphanomyces astaci]|uniref:Phospholipid-transporting ATPase n=2 Tax=Aphanomyces astaci TaxID=112090 RepID=A0A6A4ZHA3_APHAT|nr:hypothetical protein AaE_013656 [Aphanomyces astaci]